MVSHTTRDAPFSCAHKLLTIDGKLKPRVSETGIIRYLVAAEKVRQEPKQNLSINVDSNGTRTNKHDLV